MDIKCVPLAEASAPRIYRKLLKVGRDNNLTDLSGFYGDIIDTLFKSQPNLKTRFELDRELPEDYIFNVASMIRSMVTSVEGKLKEDSGDDVTSFIPLSVENRASHELRDNLIKSLTDRIKVVNNPFSVSFDESIDETQDISDRLSDEASGVTKTNHDITIADFLADRAKLKVKDELESKMTRDEFARVYFKDFPELFNDFRSYVVNKFYNNLVDTEVVDGQDPLGYNTDMDQVIHKTREAIQKESSETTALLDRYKSEMSGDLSREVREAYYAKVASLEFDNALALNVKGIKMDESSVYSEVDASETIRKTYSDVDGSFSQSDQSSPLTKLHITNTPRLSRDENGNLIKSISSDFLTDYEISAIADDLNNLPQDLELFRSGLKRLSNSKGLKGDTFLSLYHHFFSDESYTVDGVERFSLDMLAQMGNSQSRMSNNVVSSLITFFTSAQSSDRLSVINGKIEATTTNSTDLGANILNDYNISIQRPDNRYLLKRSIQENISLAENPDGSIVIRLGKDILVNIPKGGIDITGKNGHIVKLGKQDNRGLNSTHVAVTALKTLGFPSYVDNRFIEHYKYNVGDSGSRVISSDDMSIPTMIANFAYMAAMNTKSGRDFLNSKNLAVKEIEKDSNEGFGLPYPPFKHAWAFRDTFVTYLEATTGITAKKNVKNTNGDTVATVTTSHVMGRTKQLINKVRDTEGSVHTNNILVDRKSGWVLERFLDKDGIKVNGKPKKTGALTMAEHYKYLMEDAFLRYTANNNYKKVIVQPGAMADRSRVPVGVFQGRDIIPRDFREDIDQDGMNSLQRDLVNSEKASILSQESIIVKEWKDQLSDWATRPAKWKNFTNEQIDAIDSFESLQEFLSEAKIPMDNVKRSKRLVSELMYVNNDGNAAIKKALVHMKGIWSNPVKAKMFVEANYAKFLFDLDSSGYSADTMSKDALRSIGQRFNTGGEKEASFNVMTEAYFYRSTMLANASLTLNAGSFFQFPGDMQDMSTDPRVIEFAKSLRVDGKVSAESKAKIKEAAEALSINQALHNMMTPQSKRNSLITSGAQRPRLFGKNEEGKGLGYTTNTVVITDPEEVVSLLGNLSGALKQEIYDAAQLVHPLYLLKLNESLGNEASGFMTKGGAVKDISVEIDPRTGVNRSQKKASFNAFAGDLMAGGTPAAHRLFRKMNTAVKYNNGKGVFIDLASGKIVPAKGEDTIYVKHLQDLWENMGGFDSPNSWELVLNILGKNPEIREAYVEKVGFKSGEKTGNRGFNTSDVWNSDSDKSNLVYTEYSNEGHGVILNSDHDPDVSNHKSEKALMTQIISAAVLQGETASVAAEINKALRELSEIGLNRVTENVRDESVAILRARVKTGLMPSEQVNKAAELIAANDTTPGGLPELDTMIDDLGIRDIAVKEYVRKLTEDAINTRESAEITKDLVKSDKAALDSMQLYKAVHSAVMAEINRATTKVKFKGQEFVVSASYDFLKMYNLDGTYVSRKDYMNSDLVEETILSKQELAMLIPTDMVTYDGQKMSLQKATKAAGSIKDLVGKVKGKVIGEGRPLKWSSYSYTTLSGDVVNVEDLKLYKDLQENGTMLSDRGISDDVKNVLLEERTKLETKLKELFEDPNLNWKTTDAEFYMPMMHAKVFNLNKPGTTEPDTDVSISDIIGTEQTGQMIFLKNGKIVPEEESDMSIFESEYNSMIKFFKGRIIANRRELKFDRKFRKFSGNRPDKQGMTYADFNRLLEDQVEYGNSLEENSLEDIASNKMMNILDDISDSFPENVKDDELVPYSEVWKINQVSRENKDTYVQMLAEKQARSFPKTLVMFAARIPAQGKQSGVVGVVKGFITSNRNAIFGPAEMLTVTGADHDIDKSHVLVYSTDNEGAIYDYTPYLGEDGSISRDKYNTILNDKIKRKVEHSKYKGLSEEVIADQVSSLKKYENLRLEEATKNLVLDKLAIIWRDPKNAVEAATPISIEELKNELKAKEASTGKITLKNGHPIISSDEFISPYTPSSIPMLERINSIGKKLVGINATGIKGFSAITTAALSDMDNEFIKYPDEKQRLFSGSDTAQKSYEQLVGTSKNTYNLFSMKDGKLVSTPRKFIANTDKFASENSEVENSYRVKVDRLKALGKSEEEIDKELINDADKIMSNSWKEDDQAWDSLSQLLSAATDNAKELLLGRLGIDSTTNGLVVAGITIGFKIKDILNLMDNPDVKRIIKLVDDSNDTTKTKEKAISLERALSEYMDEMYEGDEETGKLSFLEKVEKAEKRLDKMETIKFDSAYADVVRLKSGVSSESELRLIYPGNFDKYNTKTKSSTTPKKGLTLAEKGIKNNLLKESGLPIRNVDDRSLRTMFNSKNIIMGEGGGIMNTNLEKLAIAYATANGKTLHSVSQYGTFKVLRDGKMVSTDAPPTITDATGLLFEKAHSGVNTAINIAVKRTIDAFTMGDAEFDAIIDEAKLRFESDKTDTASAVNSMMSSYLVDGPRQLKELVSAANEMRAITSVLGINGGIPNDSIKAFSFFNNFKKLVNRTEGFDMGAEGLKNFILSLDGSLEEDTPGDYARMLIESYDRRKTALNPFYIISKNDHYLGYLKSLIYGQDLIRQATFTNELVEKLIYSKVPNTDVIGADSIGEITNFVYSVGIDLFLKESNKTAFSVDGNTYNLTNNSGRSQFVKDMVKITNKFRDDNNLSENSFIKKLFTDTSRDVGLNSFMDIIKTRDLNTMSPHAQSDMKLGLNRLKEMGGEYAKFHDALFYYSLIMNKGSIGRSSFSALFGMDTDGVEEYNVKFLGKLNERKAQVLDQVNKMGDETFLLNNPSLMPTVDTIEEAAGMTMEQMEAEAEIQQAYAEAGIPYDATDYSASAYDLSFNNPKTKKKLWKSAQTGKIYYYNETYKRFLVITPKFPTKSIPFTTGLTGINAAGYQYGETVQINPQGETGQVLYYDTMAGNYVVEVNGTDRRMSDLILSSLNSDMIFRGKNFGNIAFEDRNNKLLSKTKSKPSTTVNVETNEDSPRESGDFTIKFKKIVHVDYKHNEMASRADVTMGFDTKSAVSDKSSGFVGTPWIANYKEALGDSRLSNVKASEKVMFYGSRLEDGNTPDEIKATFESIKPYIDHVASKGAEILVGNSTGIDEEIRSYIAANYPSYGLTGTGFKVGAVAPEGRTTTLWKSGKRVGRFNSNNTLNREGDHRGTTFGTILYDNPSTAKHMEDSTSTYEDYEVTMDNVLPWDSQMDPETLMDMMYDSGVNRVHVGRNKFSAIQDRLVIMEQEFAKQIIGDLVLRETNNSKEFKSIDEFNAYIDKLKKEDKNDFVEIYEGFKSRIINNQDMFNIGEAGVMAMARNRDITIGYLQEEYGSISKIEGYDIKNLTNFNLFNNSRISVEKSKDYLNMINEGTIADSTVKAIMESKPTVRDAYSLIRTFAPNKIFSKGMVIDGESTNRLFTAIGVDAFSIDQGFVVLNNDKIQSWNEDGGAVKMDTDANNNYKVSSKNSDWKGHTTDLDSKKVDAKFQKDPVTFKDTIGKTYASKMVSRSVITKVFEKLSLNSNIDAVTMSNEDIQSEYGPAYAGKPGFTTSEGLVVINLDFASLDTPMHEFGHVYLAHLKATNPEAYAYVISESLKHEIRSEVEANYKENNEEQLGGEIFSTLLGIENQVKTEEELDGKPMSKWQMILKSANEASSIIDFFNRAFNSIFGTSTPYNVSMGDSLSTIIEGIGTDLLTNKNSVLSNLSRVDKKNIKKVMNDVLEEGEILDKLKNMDFIQKICR